MHFKPLGHLARISFAKGLAHAYTPGAVVAGQQSLGSIHNYPVNKFSKATQLQNAFSTTSGSSGPGAKAGHVTGISGGDSGLAQYYAAWQHAQQTGDDTDWKQHQFARRIGWTNNDKALNLKQPQRLESIKPADILRQPARTSSSHAYSDSATLKADEAFTEAEALAKIDEAIAQEIKDVKESSGGRYENIAESSPATTDLQQSRSDANNASDVDTDRSPSTNFTSPISDQSMSLSDEIITLGEQRRYADIPSRFQSMVQNGLVPNVTAYNYIIRASIHLSTGYQPYPRALEIYGDMTNRGVQADQAIYQLLISFLTSQSLEATMAHKEIDKHMVRYGQGQGSFILPSMEIKKALYTGDMSLKFATKLYNIARRTVPDFSLTESQYTQLSKAFKQSGSASSMVALLSDMLSKDMDLAPELYVSIMDACASIRDLSTAKDCYQRYREIAMSRNDNGYLDVRAYTALIKAYYASGEEEDGLRFFENITQSFENSSNKESKVQEVTDAFVVDGLVQHYVDTGNLHQALESMKIHQLSDAARARAINKVLVAASDSNQKDIVITTFPSLTTADTESETVMAVAAMHFRAGEIAEARAAWNKGQHVPSLSFATMYALSFIRNGMIEQALAEVRVMFRQVRGSSTNPSHPLNNRVLDEPIALFGQALSAENVLYSSQVAILLFRLMVENGALVPGVAQDAIARVGPECVDQLSVQDIALALHVQSLMLLTQKSAINDTAQAARFSHLLETVLDRGILMDPSTLHIVSDALPRLEGVRPDLEQRWCDLLRPAQQASIPAQVRVPVVSQVPAMSQASATTSYDPYAHTTDQRASKVISDLLESTSGRIENNLSDAMARLRNVRRMGRHLQYNAYAKLVTAAGKAKQRNLMHELLAMAQTDVPFNPRFPAVNAGWVTIYDSMVAACLTVGDSQLAAKYHQEIRAMGAAPSANTFGIYITTLEGTFDEATEAVKIFQRAIAEGVTPSVFLFNAVIGKLGKARRIDDCLQYFGQMQSLGIRPSSVTYGTLVNALCRTSEESFAIEMFDEMEGAPNYRPRPAPYNSIIQYFLNTKRDRSKVLQYYGRMRSKNIKPTSHTYKLLIESYATLEPINLTAAETVLEDMKANGVQPEAVHYGSLIHAKGCVMSDMASARAVFDSVMADSSIKPTDNLYQNLFEAMVANHLVTETEAVLADMAKHNIAMTPYIANTLIHGWAGQGELKKAKSIYDKLGVEKREPSTYEHMTRAFLSAEDHAGAQNVVTEMLSKGYPSAVADKVLALVNGNGV